MPVPRLNVADYSLPNYKRPQNISELYKLAWCCLKNCSRHGFKIDFDSSLKFDGSVVTTDLSMAYALHFLGPEIEVPFNGLSAYSIKEQPLRQETQLVSYLTSGFVEEGVSDHYGEKFKLPERDRYKRLWTVKRLRDGFDWYNYQKDLTSLANRIQDFEEQLKLENLLTPT